MAATIFTFQIADPDLRKQIQEVIGQETSHLTPDCEISVIEAQTNDQWEVRIDCSGRPRKSEMFDGTAGEHQPEVFRRKLRNML
jgi:hypothetical protein